MIQRPVFQYQFTFKYSTDDDLIWVPEWKIHKSQWEGRNWKPQQFSSWLEVWIRLQTAVFKLQMVPQAMDRIVCLYLVQLWIYLLITRNAKPIDILNPWPTAHEHTAGTFCLDLAKEYFILLIVAWCSTRIWHWSGSIETGALDVLGDKEALRTLQSK